jgi:hypothetical protein
VNEAGVDVDLDLGVDLDRDPDPDPDPDLSLIPAPAPFSLPAGCRASASEREPFRGMLALALALSLVLASPGTDPLRIPAPAPALSQRLDSGPFGGGELMLASTGALAGDALVIGGGYLALALFARGTLEPSAGNFRTTAYVLGASALLVPPLTAVLLAKLGASGPLAGGVWKAMLLAAVGQVAALAAGYLAAPHLWVVLPVQLAAVSLGTSVGLHWGPRGALGAAAAAPEPEVRQDRAGEPSAALFALFTPRCPDA